MEKIIGIGNALVDVLVQLPDERVLSTLGLQKGGMTLIDDVQQQGVTEIMDGMEIQVATGGSAGNTILALGRLGAEPAFVGKTGEDRFAAMLADCYRQSGIELRTVTCPLHTGVANTFITPGGERTFATCLGAAAMMEPDEVREQWFQGYQILHVEGYLVQNHAFIEKVMDMAHSQGLKISIDMASYNVVEDNRQFFRHLVEDYVDIVFANEEESAAFTGCSDPAEALQQIAQMCQIAVVKLGARGATAMSGGAKARVPARKVQVVDTTAAGDFFAGGFLYALTHGADLESCLECGAMLSENVIQVVGTQLDEGMWQTIRQNVQEILR